MYGLLATLRPFIHFAYGLSVFLMGWTIWIQPKSSSNLRLARSLPYLAAFGVFRGLSVWETSHLATQENSYIYTHLMPRGVAVLTAVSFFFLYLFGCDLVRDLNRRLRWLPYTGVALIFLWAVQSDVLWVDLSMAPSRILLVQSEEWARYLLVVPGKLLAAVGLYVQTRQFRAAGLDNVVPDLRGASVAMGIYAFGSLVPVQHFYQIEPLVIMLRSACAMVLAVFLIRTMRVFDTEIRHRLEQAEAAQAAAEERERLGLELHDGILQSIYATGLGLEVARRRIMDDPAGAAQRVTLTLERLNLVIDEIRAYIRTLTTAPATVRDLQTAVQNIAEESLALYGVPVKVTADVPPGSTLVMFPLDTLVPILKETLSNIGRHAHATQVDIRLSFANEMLALAISDDGRGFDLEQALAKQGHYGLRNLQRRAEGAGGGLRIFSEIGKGTRIEAILPLQKGEGVS